MAYKRRERNVTPENAPEVTTMLPEEVEAAQAVAEPETIETVLDPQCMYAGDIQDENCKDCDGYNFRMRDGTVRNATECNSFQQGTPPEDWEQFYAEGGDVDALAATNTPESPAMAPIKLEKSEVVVSPTLATTSVIRAEIAITRELVCEDSTKSWIKVSYSESRTMPEGEFDLQNERNTLFSDVEDEALFRVEQAIRDSGL